MSGTRLQVVPLELREANAFINEMHRHHQPVNFHRFSIGCIDDEAILRGVAVIGRPAARLAGSARDVLEVSRLATDGTYNACSILYAAAARAGRAMGYKRIQTYTLPEEGGASLRASGWVNEGLAGGGKWNRPTRERNDNHPTSVKTRWSLTLGDRLDPIMQKQPNEPDSLFAALEGER